MAFQNKGSSIFEYGSHLPLIKLSGYTLCIELLIRKYLISINNDIRYSNLLLFLFDIVDGNGDTNSIKEVPFNDLLNKIQNTIPHIGKEIANYVYNEISLILNNEETDLFNYFENDLKSLISTDNNDNNNTYLSKSSLFGIFHRKLMICYNHSSFDTLDKFVKNIKKYHDNRNNNKQNGIQLNNLKYPYELDEKIYELSKNNIIAKNNNNNNNKLFEIISDLFPDLASTHYLNMILFMNNNEYISSLSYLHKYFDFVASSFKMNWNDIINDKSKHNKMNQKQYQSLLQKKRKKMQYSLLCKAMFYAYFGHYNLAIQQITEALQRAQNIGDRTCVSCALYLLVEFLSDQCGNINLIKQIYENCIQNVSSIPSVHISSLIGLTKWNLYHICVYRTKSRPYYLWQYLYFANKMIVLNDQNYLHKYFGEIHSMKANAWNLYANYELSSISYQIFIINHLCYSKNINNRNFLHIANYLRFHCSYELSISILAEKENKNIVLNEMCLLLLLAQAINCKDLKLATIYQNRLSELVSTSHDLTDLYYLEMMFWNSQIRFEYGEYMEASRIINNLISLCNRRSLQSLTIPYYLFLAKIHLKSHCQITQIMSYVLKAWSICKTYHFYYWLPQCVIELAKLHLDLNNIQQSFTLIQQHLPIILKKNNYLIVEAYINLAKCCLQNNHFVNSIQYFHIARIWCLKLMKTQESFKNSCSSKELLQKIYYFLARIYENISDTVNRDKSAQKMFEIDDNNYNDN